MRTAAQPALTPTESLITITMTQGHSTNGEWVAKYYHCVPWDTTSDPADLDAEVNAGARILTYSDGAYVHAIHRHYPNACGPASLAMALKQLGIARPGCSLALPLNVDSNTGKTIDVGYVGSMEHLMWLGYHRGRLPPERRRWNRDEPRFMAPEGDLNIAPSGRSKAVLGPNGEMDYLNFTTIPKWMWYGPAVGTGNDRSAHSGLTGIMSYIIAGWDVRAYRDATPLTTHSRNDDEVRAVRRIFTGFIDNNIALVPGIESGSHFNVVIGYRGSVDAVSEPFFIYTADPLDGWGRPKERRPGRWRRLNVVKENLFDGRKLIVQLICWNQHLAGGCEPGGWARKIDAQNGNDWLCGRPRRIGIHCEIRLRVVPLHADALFRSTHSYHTVHPPSTTSV